MDFSNLTVIITGVSSDIGKTIADILVSGGAKVIGTYYQNKLKDRKIDTLKCDVSKEQDVIKLYDYIMNKYDGAEVLINCSALCKDNYFLEKDAEEFMQVLKVNMLGTFLLCKYFAKNMTKGTVINISSLDASKTYNEYNMDYASSKAGVENLTKNFAQALPNLKFCALAPAWVDTKSVRECDPNYLKEEMKKHEQERLLTKEEVALKVIEMVVNNDDYISGDIVVMDKGDEYHG